MHRYYCSYFDRNYLLKALSLIASLNRHCSRGFTLYAVCLDELTRTILDRLALPNVVTVPLHSIEENDAELLAAKGTRSIVEYYWTLTPSIILWLLDRHPEIELLTYLDADLYFYSDSEPIFEELGESSILIHEHRFPEMLKHLEIYGKYNVGLLCFRRDANALEALTWWRERCNEWCYCKIDNNRYGDQLYLDDWTERFRKVHVLQHIGAGVAPWNHIQYRFRTEGDRVWLDDRQVVFYHFHSLDLARPGIVVPAKFALYPLRDDIITTCVIPYVQELLRAAEVVRKELPGFSYGLVNDRVLSADQTVLAQREYAPELKRIGLSHPIVELSDGWQCHCSAQLHPSVPPYPSRNSRLPATSRQPKITIVVPSYNQAEYLGACLDSILSQEYPNLELIVMDGGSSDGSVEIIRKYQDRLAYWQSGPDGGQYQAINEGFRRSTGEIMGWLNSDDMLHQGGLQVLAEVFTRLPQVEFVTGRRVGFDARGDLNSYGSETKTWCRGDLLDRKLIHDFSLFVMQEATYWRRSLWTRAGATLDPAFRLAADFELWVRFSRQARLHTVDALIGGFRYYSPEQRCNRFRGAYLSECDAVIDRESALPATELDSAPPPALIRYPLRDDSAGPMVASAGEPPRISLVIPSYNYGEYLAECLDSILSQNYPNLELIVMDGGSSDDSPQIIKRHERYLAHWQSRPDAGQYSAIEEGFRRSTGEIMTWLNADDKLHAGALATVSGIFSRNTEVEWLMGRPNSFDEQGRQKIVLSFLPMNSRAKFLAGDNFIQQEGVFWRRALWQRSGAYLDKELTLAADLELWGRFFRSAALFSVDALIAGFRDHPLQKSKDKAGYTAEAQRVRARERDIFAAERPLYNPVAPLPILPKGAATS